jgi:hypothetical protein
MRVLMFALLLASPAMASGYIEAPPESRLMASFADCLAELKARSASDIQAALAAPLPKQTITLVTDGVQTGGSVARYQSDLWYLISRRDIALGLTVTSHSYTRVVMTCNGATLSVIDGRGYTLDTFE